jgi:hypothetical protein
LDDLTMSFQMNVGWLHNLAQNKLKFNKA